MPGPLYNTTINEVVPGTGLAPAETVVGAILSSSADALTAHSGGGQANALPITSVQSRFTTVAAAGDSAVLPPAVPGEVLTVVNAAAVNAMNVFPNAADNGGTGGIINALAANAAYSVVAAHIVTFMCFTAGKWVTSNVVAA